MNKTTYHELAHASHFQKLTFESPAHASEYWADYINYIIVNGPYGDITKFNSGVCGIGEMWGFAMGNILVHEKYGGDVDNRINSNDYWFQYKILQSLISEGHLTKKQVYDGLSFWVRSHDALKLNLITMYPNKQDIIIQKFQYYGF